MYQQAGDHRAAQLLAASNPRLDITNYDNWNGGTYQYALRLSVPPREYAAYPDQASLDQLEEDLLQKIGRFTRTYPNEFLEAVVLLPDLDLDDSPAPLAQPSFWQEGFMRLFISHVATIKDDASSLSRQLSALGISGFVAHEDIEPTKEWEDEIRLGLSTCDALLALLTPEFHESKWTDQEVGVAVGRGILVIPIRLGFDPYGFIGRYQGVQGQGLGAEQLAESIFEIALKHPATRRQIAHGQVKVFEGSDSFAEARTNAARLQRIVAWDEELAGRVRRAVEENDQISNAWGVLQQVDRLLRRAGLDGVVSSSSE